MTSTRAELLEEMCKQETLQGERRQTFIAFMNVRFPEEMDREYLHEWAVRFSNGIEWRVADGNSKRALLLVNRSKYLHNQEDDDAEMQHEIEFEIDELEGRQLIDDNGDPQ